MMDRKEQLKSFLGQYKKAKKRKTVLEQRLREAKIEIEMPLTGMRYTDMPNGSGVSEGAATLAIRKVQLEESIAEQKELMLNIICDVMKVIEFLPSTSEERQIIEHRYIECYSWTKIQRLMCYSRSSCFDKFNKGLDQLLAFRGVIEILDEYITE